jgi:hypothetical protein
LTSANLIENGPSTSYRDNRGTWQGSKYRTQQTGRHIRVAFVATNSISQGEQVAQLWPILFDRFHLEIAFAHRTFSWGSEARGAAHVHVVVIGLTHRDEEPSEKRLFSYPDIRREPIESRHDALTAYLFDARGVTNRHLVVREEARPINRAPRMVAGSQPIDYAQFVLDPAGREALLAEQPAAADYIRPYVAARISSTAVSAGSCLCAALIRVGCAKCLSSLKGYG